MNIKNIDNTYVIFMLFFRLIVIKLVMPLVKYIISICFKLAKVKRVPIII